MRRPTSEGNSPRSSAARMKALADQPDLLSMSPVEQQRALLEVFAIE